MLEPRLASHIQIDMLKRRASQIGGFATIVHKGDPVSGAILILCVENGANPILYEKMPCLNPGAQSGSAWQIIWSDAIAAKGKSGTLDEYLDRRRTRDSDLWTIELDVAHHTRFDEIVDALG